MIHWNYVDYFLAKQQERASLVLLGAKKLIWMDPGNLPIWIIRPHPHFPIHVFKSHFLIACSIRYRCPIVAYVGLQHRRSPSQLCMLLVPDVGSSPACTSITSSILSLIMGKATPLDPQSDTQVSSFPWCTYNGIAIRNQLPNQQFLWSAINLNRFPRVIIAPPGNHPASKKTHEK